jgi:hypothetical protein
MILSWGKAEELRNTCRATLTTTNTTWTDQGMNCDLLNELQTFTKMKKIFCVSFVKHATFLKSNSFRTSPRTYNKVTHTHPLSTIISTSQSLTST